MEIAHMVVLKHMPDYFLKPGAIIKADINAALAVGTYCDYRFSMRFTLVDDLGDNVLVFY